MNNNVTHRPDGVERTISDLPVGYTFHMKPTTPARSSLRDTSGEYIEPAPRASYDGTSTKRGATWGMRIFLFGPVLTLIYIILMVCATDPMW